MSAARRAVLRAKPPATLDATARRQSLAKDPATDKFRFEEADAVLAAESQGLIAAPVTRSAHPGADFIDASGQRWDVKAFRSLQFLPEQLRAAGRPPGHNGAFTLARALEMIAKEIRIGQKIIIDTRFLSVPDLASLRDAISSGPQRGDVIWVAATQ
ncbi:MAG: hypothetical protein IPL79_11280 [Myxococcales bacterium]|nr:hypothetical protein [Myxococcales bacterium]